MEEKIKALAWYQFWSESYARDFIIFDMNENNNMNASLIKHAVVEYRRSIEDGEIEE